MSYLLLDAIAAGPVQALADTKIVLSSTRSWVAATVIGLGLALSGCAIVGSNQPHNRPLDADAGAVQPALLQAAPDDDRTSGTAVAMSFSGGGLRAAAFASGAMQGLSGMPGPRDRNLLEQVNFITSVSGGSLTAAWVGLNGTGSLSDFRRAALLHEGGRQLGPEVRNSVSLMRLAGDGLVQWLDEEVFHGATFASMDVRGRPVVWINATNLNQRLPFAFHQASFDALCSDIGSYPVSDAVAASMAVPLVFAPIVLEKHPESCSSKVARKMAIDRPEWHETMLAEAVNDALLDYGSLDSGRYVKLVDGGLTDNFGLSSIQQSRLLTGSLLSPFSEAQALRIRRLLFVVVDGGRRPAVDWNRGIDGPTGLELALASVDAAIDTNMRMSYDSFLAMTRRWRDDVVDWRCARPADEKQREQARRADWRCDDLQITVSRISFDDLPPARARRLHGISTSLTLSQGEVDAVIDAGRDAVAGNSLVNDFSKAVHDDH